ncbi:MAG TPA: 5'/3'-nucleotidase SurE [Polyangiales bacterium]|jgi:5'-nucleotidase|nr:5'/3'-nucleotidase SurE [Polyangiales bacterium]
MPDRPLILVTNDDGALARGITALRKAAEALGDVVVVAPTREQSATSHAITIDRPLRHIEHEAGVHSIDGTPADCVYLALFEPRFLPRRPDIVLSGINHGPNLGTSVFYSGTVAGAREAALRGIPAIAFSAPVKADLPQVAQQCVQLAARLLTAPSVDGSAVLLNVNFPETHAQGVRVTRVGRQIYEENVIPRRDPGGREYFWIGGRLTDAGDREGTDAQAVSHGYVSVTALALEATNPEHRHLAALVAGQRESADNGERT